MALEGKEKGEIKEENRIKGRRENEIKVEALLQ